MRKYIFFLFLVTGIWACSKEDWPDNSAPERNWLAPEEGAADETSVLRREFYKRNGVYLLFSDTLGVREKKTLAGKTVYEYQILGYDMFTPVWSEDSFSYHYYTVYDEQREAAKFVEEQILPAISEVFWPNALLLLNRLEYFKYNYWPAGFVFSNLSAYNKLQGMILGCGDIWQATDPEKEALKNDILKGIVLAKTSLLPAEELELFYNYSKDWYNVNTYQIPDLQAVGLLQREGVSYWTTDKDHDLAAFIERIFSLSKPEFYETFSDYPLVLKKMEVLVSILQKYGVKIYMEA